VIWSLPNQITLARLGLAAGLFALIAFEQWWAALAVFALAAFSDWLDGYIARRWNLGTPLGRVLDPLVDKVMMAGVFIFLLPKSHSEGWLTAWMVTVVIGRELLVTGLREAIERGGTAFGADWLGKLKMILQCAAVVAVFLSLAVPNETLNHTRNVLIWAMLAATVLSGLQYLYKAVRLLGRRET
jgi:CDP-diacylglycerol--glycerol-3-phosphate 3-phosphatidyltransferase